MVTLKSIEMHGFKQFSEPTEFSFADGINVINGPNEAGKSTILDAVIAAIFGATPSEIPPLQSWGNPDACRVRLEYEVDDAGYAIERYLADRKATLFKHQGGKFVKVTSARAKIEDAIDKHFGFREKRVFENTLVIRQNDIAFLPDKKVKDKTAFDKLKMMIDKATSGAEDTDTALSTIISDVGKRIHELRTPRGKGALDALEERIHEAEEELSSARTRMEAVDGNRQRLDELTQEIDARSTHLTTLKDRREIHETRARIEERRAEIASREKGIQDILDKVSDARDEIKKVDSEAGPLEKKYGPITEDTATAIPKLSEKIRASEERVAELEKELKGNERDLELEREKLVQYPGFESLSDDEVHRVRVDIDYWVRLSRTGSQSSSSGPGATSQASPIIPLITLLLISAAGLATGNLAAGLIGGIALALVLHLALGRQPPTTTVSGSATEKAELEQRFSDIKEKVHAFNPDTFPSMIKRYQELTASIETDQRDIDKIKENIEKEQERRQNATDELGPIIAKVPGFSNETFTKEYSRLTELENQRKIAETTVETLLRDSNETALKDELRDLASEGRKMDVEWEQKQLDLHKLSPEQVRELAEIDKLEGALRGMISERDTLEGRVDEGLRPGEDPVALEETLDSLKYQKDSLEHTYTVYTTLLEFLNRTDGEIKSRFAPQITERLNGWLSRITDERYGECHLDTDLVLTVDSPDKGDVVTIEELSQGTQDQVYLGLRTIIGDVIASDKNVPVFLDDTMHSFDIKRLENARAVLSEISKKKQVFILSHDAKFKDWSPEGTIIELGV